MADFTITITVPQAKAVAIANAFDIAYTKPYGISKEEFVRNNILQFIRDVYKTSKRIEINISRKNINTTADIFTDDITVI